jgi:ACR3 family arsenite transporter
MGETAFLRSRQEGEFNQLDSYIAGLILLAAAPCTAMVFVWSNLCKGDSYFTLSQVALNDAIIIIGFAPLVALLLGMSAITVPWHTLIISVGLYIVIPVIFAQGLRKRLLARGDAYFQRTVVRLGPYSICALLATLILLFAFQGQAIVSEPLIIAMLAVPILIQVFFNSGLAYLLNRRLGVAHCIAGPSSLIGASNFDWLPLESGGVRPTQGRTLAVMQVCGGSQSFNAVNALRVLGRWMRMVTIPNQSSVAKA